MGKKHQLSNEFTLSLTYIFVMRNAGRFLCFQCGFSSTEEGNEEDIIARIKEASQYVPLDRLCLSPQCGFSSTEEGNELTEEDQWSKLELIKTISEKVWGK